MRTHWTKEETSELKKDFNDFKNNKDLQKLGIMNFCKLLSDKKYKRDPMSVYNKLYQQNLIEGNNKRKDFKKRDLIIPIVDYYFRNNKHDNSWVPICAKQVNYSESYILNLKCLISKILSDPKNRTDKEEKIALSIFKNRETFNPEVMSMIEKIESIRNNDKSVNTDADYLMTNVMKTSIDTYELEEHGSETVEDTHYEKIGRHVYEIFKIFENIKNSSTS